MIISSWCQPASAKGVPEGSRMNDMPLERCSPSGDWPTVWATQWKILLFGPTGRCAADVMQGAFEGFCPMDLHAGGLRGWLMALGR